MQQRAADEARLSAEAIVAAWDGQLRLLPNAAFSSRGAIAALVDATARAFPNLRDLDLEQLKLGACFFSDAIVEFDDVLDYAEEQPARVRDVLNVIPMQFESFRIFAELFGDMPEFWRDLRRYFVEYVGAMNREFEIKSDPAAWEACDERACLRIAEQKNGLVRAVAAAFCAATGERERLPALEQIVLDLFVGSQMMDDVRDWREDLGTGRISTLLRLACPARPSPADADAVARSIFLGRKAHHVLSHGIDLLDAARQRASAFGANDLAPLIALRHRQLITVRDGVEEELRRAPVRGPALQLVVDVAPTALHEPLRRGLAFLADHAARGFWEARHWIKLGDMWGTNLPDVVCGDVFARAMICDALCDLRERGVRGLDRLIAAQSAYLSDARNVDEAGGWSYLAQVELLPSDADTTAQVLQALARDGHAAAAFDRAAPALELFFAQARGDGAYGTWALRPPELSELDRRRYEVVRDVVGLDPHVDVIANMSYALHAFAAPAFGEQVARSAAFVERAQNESGLWYGPWYEGVYYPTFAAVRFLTAFDAGGAAMPAVRRALRRLLADQHADGGWGAGDDGDSLSTALAMSTLVFGRDAAGDAVETALAHGARYLAGRCARDGSWEAVPFVRLYHGKAELASRSRCVTTAFVLRALASAGRR